MMKRFIGCAGAAVVGGMVALGTAGMAAAAPAADGQTSGAPVAAVQAKGGASKVATLVGVQSADAQCVVTHASNISFARPGGKHQKLDSSMAVVAVNCTHK